MIDLSEFKVYNYPDGHKHIVSDKDLKGNTVLSASIRTFDDLFLIAQVRRIHPELDTLKIKYLLAGRCDRRFSPGETIDIEIVCNFINDLGFMHVDVLKPHSEKTSQCLRGFLEWDVTRNLIDMCRVDLGNFTDDQICYVSPDAGASRWINQYKLHPIIQGNKKRDANGVVTGVEFIRQHSYTGATIDSLHEQRKCNHFVIIDDLCDGGATFIAIAKEIHLRFPNAKVYLVVTHAIFSKGFTPFEGQIERIYCTNSFADWDNPLVKQLKI